MVLKYAYLANIIILHKVLELPHIVQVIKLSVLHALHHAYNVPKALNFVLHVLMDLPSLDGTAYQIFTINSLSIWMLISKNSITITRLSSTNSHMPCKLLV